MVWHVILTMTVSKPIVSVSEYKKQYNNLMLFLVAQHEDVQRWVPQSVHLWKLKKRALPEMVNLQHFGFIPKTHTLIPSEDLLYGCHFQLRSFIWKFAYAMPRYVADFLFSQNRLLHCEVVYDTGGHDHLMWLPPTACPNLISTSILCQFLPALIHRKNIVALQLDIPVGEYSSTEDNHTVLRRLKYLSVTPWMLAVGFPGIMLPNIIVLDICHWWGPVSCMILTFFAQACHSHNVYRM